jgi:hypothetical protein
MSARFRDAAQDGVEHDLHDLMRRSLGEIPVGADGSITL